MRHCYQLTGDRDDCPTEQQREGIYTKSFVDRNTHVKTRALFAAWIFVALSKETCDISMLDIHDMMDRKIISSRVELHFNLAATLVLLHPILFPVISPYPSNTLPSTVPMRPPTVSTTS